MRLFVLEKSIGRQIPETKHRKKNCVVTSAARKEEIPICFGFFLRSPACGMRALCVFSLLLVFVRFHGWLC